MNDCNEALEALALRAADEIDTMTGRALDQHLASCQACPAESERLQAILEVMKTVAPPDPGPVYWTSFQARLQRRIARRSRSVLARTLVGLAAGVLVVLGLGVLLRGGRIDRQPARTGFAAKEAATEDGAEARFEAVLGRMSEKAAGENEFESILDELVPVDPLAAEDPGDRSGPEQSGATGRAQRPEVAG